MAKKVKLNYSLVKKYTDDGHRDHLHCLDCSSVVIIGERAYLDKSREGIVCIDCHEKTTMDRILDSILTIFDRIFR